MIIKVAEGVSINLREFLTDLARRDEQVVRDTLLRTSQMNPSFAQIVHATSDALKAPVPCAPARLQIGDHDPLRGVYLGGWEAAPGHVVYAYADEDFLRDGKGKPLVLTFNEAVKELAKRNEGRSYGDGTESALRQAIESGAYRDGDRVLPPKELLHGCDARGNVTRETENIFALLKAGKLPKIAAAVESRKGDECWAVSGSEHSGKASHVYYVRLTVGASVWGLKDGPRSAVVPVRLYRNPSLSAAPAPGG